jgi:monovalent cation:H+ antiporter-2, CPA2 family
MGNMIGRLLQVNGVKTTVLDHDPEVVDSVRKLGLRAYYGDASRLDLLHSAGAGKAKLMILALDDPAKTLEIAATVRRHFPHLELLCRARTRDDGYALVNMGIRHVFRETFGTSMDIGFEALRQAGVGGHRAHRAVQAFRAHNEAAFRELAAHWNDRKTFLEKLRGKIREADALLRTDGRINSDVDAAWENSGLRSGMEEAVRESAARAGDARAGQGAGKASP